MSARDASWVSSRCGQQSKWLSAKREKQFADFTFTRRETDDCGTEYWTLCKQSSARGRDGTRGHAKDQLKAGQLVSWSALRVTLLINQQCGNGRWAKPLLLDDRRLLRTLKTLITPITIHVNRDWRFTLFINHVVLVAHRYRFRLTTRGGGGRHPKFATTVWTVYPQNV